MIKLGNPVPIFLDARGNLADGGQIYVGAPNADPQVTPQTVYWDRALTISAAQPLQTMGGMIVNGAAPAPVFLATDDYSMRMLDGDGNLVFYSPSVFADTNAFQAHSTILDEVSASGATPYGVSLLALTGQTALAAATGIPNPLPATGGTVSGNITRQAAGVYPYWNDPAITGGRIFITAVGAADPTSLPGDIWFQY